MKKPEKNMNVDTKKLHKMATLKVENREKMTGKTLTSDQKNALIKRYLENSQIYFQSKPLKSKRGGKRKYKNKTRKRKKRRKSRKQSKKFRRSKRK
jgi:hypothetical protein